MKKMLMTAIALSSMSLAHADNHMGHDPDNKAFNPESKEQRLAYSIGSMFGGRMGQDFQELDIQSFIKGFTDSYEGKPLVMNADEITAAIQEFQQEQMEAAQREQARLAEESAAANQAWFDELAATDGVMKTESGLMYKAITQGDGATPVATDTVKVNYEGSLVDGTVFDSSYERGEPISFPLNQVIPGWTEGLQLMTVGSKYELYIPSDLAYGPGGTGPIPPNSPLKFVVELLDIETPAAE